jgi:excisionase family DNA binding protein
MNDEVFTVEEASAFLKVDVRKMLELLKSGKVSGVRIGRSFRVLKSALLNYINGESNE